MGRGTRGVRITPFVFLKTTEDWPFHVILILGFNLKFKSHYKILYFSLRGGKNVIKNHYYD